MSEWPLSGGLKLAALPSAVKLSRAMVNVTLKAWGLARMVDDAELVTSELVTNAVKATGVTDTSLRWSEQAHLATICVRLVHLGERLAIGIWDKDPTPPEPTKADGDAESGRGLMIVEALCVRWDYFMAVEGGKVIWAELEVPPLPLTEADLPQREPMRAELEYHPQTQVDLSMLRRVHRGLRQL